MGAPQIHANSELPVQLAPGLDMFAAAWLESWTSAGGSVVLDHGGRVWIGFKEYSDSPAYHKTNSDIPEAIQQSQRTFRDGRYHGGMQSLLDLLAAVPFGRDALKAHMRAHGLAWSASAGSKHP